MLRAIFIFLLAGSSWTASASNLGLDHFAQKVLTERKIDTLFQKLDASTLVDGTIQQPVNPQDPDETRMFSQRYFLNSSFATEDPANAPVIFNICGESTCGAMDIEGVAAYYAKDLKAHRVALEHRYYGLSQPFPELTVKNLQYLNTENALLDLSRFQKWAQEKYNLHGPWIVIGGSYAGNLSAIYRARFPNLVVGSLASSAPIEARLSFPEYDAVVTKTAGPECSAKIREMVKITEDAQSAPAAFRAREETFKATGIKDPVEFISLITDVAALAVQYGFKDSLCSEITKTNDLVKSYAERTAEILMSFGLNPVKMTSQGAESIDPKSYYFGWGMRAWTYQYCTEWGYLQNANPDRSQSTRSALIDVEQQKGICRRLFGVAPSTEPDALNQMYYEKIRVPGFASRIYFVNGGSDPWTILSITADRANSSNPELDMYTMPGASHCVDLSFPYNDPENTRPVRAKALELFHNWISHKEKGPIK